MSGGPEVYERVVEGITAELCTRADGSVLIRKPAAQAMCPLEWHGPYKDEAHALADYAEKRRIPRITKQELSSKKKHDYYGVVKGVPMIMIQDRWSGGTILTPYELVDGPKAKSRPA